MTINDTLKTNFPGHIIAYVSRKRLGNKVFGGLQIGTKALRIAIFDNPPNILCECGIDPDKEFKNITLVRV